RFTDQLGLSGGHYPHTITHTFTIPEDLVAKFTPSLTSEELFDTSSGALLPCPGVEQYLQVVLGVSHVHVLKLILGDGHSGRAIRTRSVLQGLHGPPLGYR